MGTGDEVHRLQVVKEEGLMRVQAVPGFAGRKHGLAASVAVDGAYFSRSVYRGPARKGDLLAVV